MKTTDFINESFVEDAAAAHQDHEVQMARGDCYNAAKYAIELHKLLKNISEQEGLDGWVSEKITLANDYLRTVTEYLRYEQQSGSSSDMPAFDVRSATQTLDSVLGESATSNLQENAFTWYLKAHGRLLSPLTSDEPYKFNSKEEAVAFAKEKYKTNWQNIVPTTYNVANSLENQPDKGWNEKNLKPVAEEEPEPKRKPAVVKTNKEIGTRVADIGPGGKEYNVKTNKAWDDQHKEVDEERTVTRDETGKIISWRDESDWRKVDKEKDGRGKVTNLSDKARKETEKLKKQQGVEEGKADPVGSWVVYNGTTVKRFKSREGAKAYAAKNGGKVASSEHYADKTQKQGVAEGQDDNGISFQIQKGKNKFATTLSIGNNSVGVYQYDANTGRSIAEVYPEFKGKGLGKLLVLHAIYTAAKLGLDFQEDESRTSEYDNVLDSLSGSGYIVDDEGYWYVTGEGEQFLKQSLKQGVAEGEQGMSRAAKGHEKYGKEGMQALAKAGREGASEKELDAIRDKHDRYDESAGGMGAASVATSMGGGNGFANGGPGTIARPRMKKKK